MNTQNKASESHNQQSSDEKNIEAHEGNFIPENFEQNAVHFSPESPLPEQLPMIYSGSKNADTPITEPETNTISDAPKNTEQAPQRINDESYRETEKNAHAHEEKKIIAQKTEQRADAMLQSIQKNQTMNVQKINITVSTPAQHQNLLATPILISNTPHWSALENMAFDEINTEPTLFVETSDTQRQLFNQNNGADTGAGESFSEGAESGAQHISASTTDVTQKTLAIQHMMETIRTRIQDANIKNSMSSDINIEFTHPTLGAVDIQLKIRDNKVSTKFFGKTEEMRTLLRQNRNEIESILKDAGLELDQDPILIYQKEI